MTRERRRAALMMTGIGLTLSVLCGWLLVSSITASFAAWQAGAAEVRISGGDVGMLTLMPIFVALTIWGTLAVFSNDTAVSRIGNRIAVLAMIAVPLAFAGSWIFHSWAAQRLAADGYVQCGAERVGRFPSITLCARKTPEART